MKDVNNKRKIIIIIAISISAIIVLILVSIIAMSQNQKTNFPDVDDGPGEEVTERSLIFYNREILTMAYNIDFSAVVLNNIENEVFSNKEMKFSKNNSPIEGDSGVYYDAIIEIDTLTFYDSYTSEFEVQISDERTYRIIVQTDTLDEDFSYVYLAISRVGSNDMMIYINGDAREKDNFTNTAKERLGMTLLETKTLNLREELSE